MKISIARKFSGVLSCEVYTGVKGCAWNFSGCIIAKLDVGRNAERKYAESGYDFRVTFLYKESITMANIYGCSDLYL